MGEVLIGHAWEVLNIEASSGPEISIFNRFKEIFHEISIKTVRKKIFDINSVSYRHRAFFINHKEIITSKLKELQREGAYQRDDYKELLNLVLMYLGENDDYVIHKPGATHKARWLMKLLHSLKIVILEESLPSDFFGRRGDKKIKINRFVTFFIFCYINWWFSCPIATSAAKNDLLFYNTICDFELIDK